MVDSFCGINLNFVNIPEFLIDESKKDNKQFDFDLLTH